MGGRGSASRMGGNGSGSASKSGSKKSGSAFASINTKFSTKAISQMNRSQLETVARAIFIKQGLTQGLSADEADWRARSLMSGNTDAQLRKYIKRNG